MSTAKLASFKVIGLYKRTSNDPGVGEKDFPAVWGEFMANDTMNKIPNKSSNNIYAIYTEYEGDKTQPYTFILGCMVDSLAEIPSGMKGVEIEAGEYNKRTVRGDLTKGVLVYNAWLDIWKENLNRSYKADFEVYDERAMNPKDAVVDIYVSI